MAFIQFQLRRGTAAEWTSANPTLAAGEMGVETDTQKFKIGDGTTAWNTLDYGGLVGATGSAGANGADGTDGEGVPVGGTTGQVLAKSSNTDYDTEWVAQTGGGSSTLDGLTDVDVSAPGSGDFLQYDGVEWIAHNLVADDVDGLFVGTWVGNTPYNTGDIVAVSDDSNNDQADAFNEHYSVYRAKQDLLFGSPDPRTFPEVWDFVSGYQRTSTNFTYVGTKDPDVDSLDNFDVFNQGAGTGLSFFVDGQVVPFASETGFNAPPIGTVFADPVGWSAGEYVQGLLVEYTFPNSSVGVFQANTTTSTEPTQSGDWDFVDVNPRFVNNLQLGELGDLSNVFTAVDTLASGNVLTYNAAFNSWQPATAPKHTFTYSGVVPGTGSDNTTITGASTPLSHISPSANYAVLNPIYLLHPGTVEITLNVWDDQDPSDYRIVEYLYYVNGLDTAEVSETVVVASTNLTDFDISVSVSDYSNGNLSISNIISVNVLTTSRTEEQWPVFVSVRPRFDAAVAPDEAFGS